MSNLLLNYPKGMFRSRRQSLLVDNSAQQAWSPSDGGFTAYWLADDISGTNGDPVGTWPDAVASHDATSSGSARPTLRTSYLNGYNAVSGDGVNDYMTASLAVSRPFTVIMVYRSVSNTGRTLSSAAGLATENWLLGSHALGAAWHFADGAVGSPQGTTGTWYVVSCEDGASGSTWWRDGALAGTSSATGVWGASLNFFNAPSASEPGNVDIAFVAVLSSIDTNVRQKAEGWVAHRYGLESNLAPGHPYKSSPPTK